MKTYVIRLMPGSDLKGQIQHIVQELNISAGWILTCVGSLRQINLRYANQENGSMQEGFFEIVSLTGTVSVNGSHLHISVSDVSGHTIGGHLLDGNLVYTTAELVLGYDESLTFTRENDGTTKWQELQIRKS
jgi:predicted DNA-binding protein with PD1-like motif